MGQKRRRCSKGKDRPATETRQADEPQKSAKRPQEKWRQDEIGGCEPIHRPKHCEPAQSRSREIREISTRKHFPRLEKDRAQKEGAGQERQKIEEEVSGETPFL